MSAPEHEPAAITDPADEDTIELELLPEEVLALSHAAEATIAPASSESANEAQVGPPATSARLQGRRWRRMAVLIGSTLTLVLVVAVGVWAFRLQTATPPPLPVIARAPIVAPPPPPPPADPPAPPVTYRNPFDHSEVFEFPAGTSRADARQAVAEMLMERARDRGPPKAHSKRVATPTEAAPQSSSEP